TEPHECECELNGEMTEQPVSTLMLITFHRDRGLQCVDRSDRNMDKTNTAPQRRSPQTSCSLSLQTSPKESREVLKRSSCCQKRTAARAAYYRYSCYTGGIFALNNSKGGPGPVSVSGGESRGGGGGGLGSRRSLLISSR
ncbi:unnamed protein product, partial [Pleuronectes platessa]